MGFATGDVARKEVLEKDVLGEERVKESLDQRLRHTVQAFQRVSWSSVLGRAPLGLLGVAAVSPPVLAGVRAAVRQVAVVVGDDIRRLEEAEAELAIRCPFRNLRSGRVYSRSRNMPRGFSRTKALGLSQRFRRTAALPMESAVLRSREAVVLVREYSGHGTDTQTKSKSISEMTMF